MLLGQDVLGIVGDADALVSRRWLARRGLVMGPAAATGGGAATTSSALVPVPGGRERGDDLPDIRNLFRGDGGFGIPLGGFRVLRPMRPPSGPMLALPGPVQAQDPSAGLADDPAVVIRQLGGDEGLVQFLLAHPPPHMEALVAAIQMVRANAADRRLILDLLELVGMDAAVAATALRLLRGRKQTDLTLRLTTVDRTLDLLRTDEKTADKLFGHLLDAEKPLSPAQLDGALGVYERTEDLDHVAGFVGGGRGAAHGQAPHTSPTSGLLPPPHALAAPGPRLSDHPLERLLGVPGAVGEVRTRIGPTGTHPRPYDLGDVVAQAQRLTALGVTGAQTLPILIQLCETQASAVALTRATAVCCEFVRLPALIPGVPAFIQNHPAIARRQDMQHVVTDLRQRTGATMPLLTSILTMLDGLPDVGAMRTLLSRFPATPDLPIGRLEARLQTTLAAPAGGGLGLTIGDVSNQANQLEQALTALRTQNRISDPAATAIRAVFELLPIPWASLQTFLAVPQVRATLANPALGNAAMWLRAFALNHQGRPAVAMADQPINVGPRVCNIDAWIMNHIRERHTFENFEFTDAVIDRAPHTTFFAAGTTDNNLIAIITRTLGHANVAAAAWNGEEINADAVQLRIRNLGGHRLRQYFFGVPAGYIRISREILHAIQHLFAWR
jgi:hypothetical protein